MPANANYGDLITTTIEDRQGALADNVSNHNALLRFLQEAGNRKLVSGGTKILQELDYGTNGTFMYYEGYEQLSTAPQAVLSAAEYEWKQWAVVVTISGREMRINAGVPEMLDLLASRLKNGERSMMNQIAVGIYSDGADAKGIDGLQLLVADDPDADVVGNIDSSNADNDFWRNYSSGDLATFDSTTIDGDMQTAWLACLRGTDHPTLITADSVAFKLFWGNLQAIQRITSEVRAASGFESLMFYGPGGRAPVMYDDQCPASHMYFLNTNYLFWKMHRDADFRSLGRRESVNQDAVVIPTIGMGNLTMSNRSLQGVIWT